MIIMVDTYERIAKTHQDRLNERNIMGLVLSSSGLGMTLTSIPTSIAFVVSALSTNIYGIKWFCTVAAWAFFLNYVLQFLYVFVIYFMYIAINTYNMFWNRIFAPLMILDNGRIKSNRNAIIPCVKYPDDYVRYNGSHDDSKELHKCSLEYILDKTLIKCLSNKIWRRLIIVIIVATWILSILATVSQRIGTDPKDIYPSDSYVYEYYTEKEKAFGVYDVSQVSIVYHNKDISDKTVRDDISLMFYEYFKLPYTIGVSEWLSDFTTYIQIERNKSIDNIDPNNIYNYLTIFANDTQYKEWNDEIILNNDINPSIIEYGRFYLTAYLPTSHQVWNNQQELQSILQDSINDYSDNTYVYNDSFLTAYVGDNITTIVVKIILLSIVSITVILLITLDIREAIFISIILFASNIVLGGWMYINKINLDVVTCIEIIMSVPLTIDYIIQITYSITHTNPQNSNDYSERISIAFNEIGISIIKSAFTTLLGIVPLIFTKTQAFISFMKMIYGIIIITCLHALILVPALLGEFHFMYDTNKDNDYVYEIPSVQMETTTAPE